MQWIEDLLVEQEDPLANQATSNAVSFILSTRRKTIDWHQMGCFGWFFHANKSLVQQRISGMGGGGGKGGGKFFVPGPASAGSVPPIPKNFFRGKE